jgi:DnaK suppressor protein
MAHLNQRELDELRLALEHERTTLQAAIATGQHDARSIPDDEIEDGDMAERVIEQDSALRASRFDKALLADVERALRKLEAGTYGTSEDSGKPIPLERLRAIPWARRTREEQEQRRRAR